MKAKDKFEIIAAVCLIAGYVSQDSNKSRVLAAFALALTVIARFVGDKES